MIDTIIAHYKITAKLGQGGMGDVYRAPDIKLGHKVAGEVLSILDRSPFMLRDIVTGTCSIRYFT